MKSYEALFILLGCSCASGEIFVNDVTLPEIKPSEIQQRQFGFRPIPGFRIPVPPVPVPVISPAPAPVPPPRPIITAAAPVIPPTRVTASGPLPPCPNKCCLRYCRVQYCQHATASKKKECSAADADPLVPASKCFNSESAECSPKKCSIPTTCKTDCFNVIDIVRSVAFCEPV